MSEFKTAFGVQSKVEGKVLILERIFNAPRELVFKTFSEAEHLANWWGPAGWQTENYEFEFKPNGVWHYCMRCVDKNQGEFYGQESWGKGVYHEIVVPEKIVFTDVFADENGNAVEGMPETLITLNFVEEDGKTKLITHSEFPSPEEAQKIVDMGVVEGTASQYNRLDEYLEKM
ncbi:SRPBCC domain-containing protein [Ornithinibacillus salinisoli]|uniref:SRPBCC domain-containing protein n=1 Tax=Ornithinibacillus salinisoli TaxID=1848459 RepID=A0ABW4W3M8_9BACI